jgi:hypothetical protein
MNKSKLIIITILISFSFSTKAAEGMWLSSEISKKMGEMRQAGLKLNASDIYSINKACIKDAVLGLSNEDNAFDSFATGSFVSGSGLVVTNFHPIIRYLEQFSRPDRDFIKAGYWSTKQEEETYCRDLNIIQLVKILDVTDEVLVGTQGLKGAQFNEKLNENNIAVKNKYTRGTGTEAKISSFKGGIQYIMSVYKVYKDIRMVAAPPITLAKFAGDVDNWRWPRHVADFAFLRIYVNQKNESATYSKDNVPLSGNPFLPISIKGYESSDFVMTAGYPARTKLHIPSFAIDYLQNKELPAKIELRAQKIKILKEAIERNPELKFRYTARINSITNNYLRWKGELKGLEKMDLLNEKKRNEVRLMEWINADISRKEKYGDIIEVQRKIYDELIPLKIADLYFNEAAISGAEIVPFAGKFEKMVQMFNRKSINEKALNAEIERLKPLAVQFFETWDLESEKQMFRNMIFSYYQHVDPKFIPADLSAAIQKFDGDIDKFTNHAFENSILTKPDQVQQFLQNIDSAAISQFKSDPVYRAAISFYISYTRNVVNQTDKLETEQAQYYNIYMQAFSLMHANGNIPADANRTQRFSFGKITGAKYQDGIFYDYYSTMDGIFEKKAENKDNPDYLIPKKIIDLYKEKSFGTYGKNGKMPVCFLTDCHTSSASSGSPVMNAKGQLIGLNFDRIAEGVASDYKFSPELSRSIAVDIRYILFLIEQYSPSKRLINELKIIK